MTHDPSPAGASSASVLLVTDEPALAETIDTALPERLELSQASTVQRAVDQFTTGESPDCVVCSQRLPNASPQALSERLGADTSTVPFVVLTDTRQADVTDAAVDRTLPHEAVTSYPGLLAHELDETLDHHRTAERLAESRDRHRSLVDDVLDNAVAGVAIYDAEGTLVWANTEVEGIFGVAVDEFLGRRLEDVQEAVDDIFERPDQFVDAYERAVDGETEIDHECHVLPGAGRDERWLVHRTRPITDGLYDGGWVSTFVDVTDRKRREQMLTALHRSTRDLMRGTSRSAVTTEVLRVADEVLGLSSVVVYRWDGEENTLCPVEWTDDFGATTGVDRPPELDGPDWVGWRAFVAGESRCIDDLHETDTPFEGASPLRSGLLVPLGEFGLLASGAERPGAYTDVDVEFAETLGANATVALERAAREQRLERQAERLDDKSTELQRATRRTQVLQAMTRTVVEASTRSDLEELACDVLADVDGLDFVWIGDCGATDDPLDPRAWAGTAGARLLDDISGCIDGCDDSPAARAAETGETQVVSNLLADDREHAWRRGMLAHGFSSTATVPLTYDDVVYGVVELASVQDAAFNDQLVAVLEDVADLLANAKLAVTRRNTLLGDERRTELEFELADTDGCGLLFRLADQLDAAVTLRDLVTDDEAFLTYVSVDGADPEAVLEYLDRTVTATDARIVESSADSCLLEVRLSDLGLMETVTAHGGTIRGVDATGATGHLLVGVPTSTEVRAFVDTIRDQYPVATLVAQRETAASDREGTLQPAGLDDQLTDRQREVLRVAYYGGYFEWPREQTGEELADRLDIASPTFQQHLREATRKVLHSMYEPHGADE
jgi:PAS domain S-box-containing protein